MKLPVVGDIVHYLPVYNSSVQAALITQVRPNSSTVNLIIFDKMGSVFPITSVPYSEKPAVEHWSHRP